jgi:RNA polymerase sigma-70 factor (ECF subfamily)
MPNHPADDQSDLRLVTAVLAGDEQAIERFLARMQSLPSIAYSLNLRSGSLLNDSELEDVVQSCLATLLRRLSSFEGRSSLESWMLGICSNQLRAAVRKKRTLPQSLVDPLVEALEAQAGAGDGVTVDFDEHELLHAALAKLPVGRARVVRLKHFEFKTLSEIAKELGMSLNAVKANYFRGLRQLRSLLAEPMGLDELGKEGGLS